MGNGTTPRKTQSCCGKRDCGMQTQSFRGKMGLRHVSAFASVTQLAVQLAVDETCKVRSEEVLVLLCCMCSLGIPNGKGIPGTRV